MLCSNPTYRLYEVQVFHVRSVALYARTMRDLNIICSFANETWTLRNCLAMHSIILAQGCDRYHKWSVSLESVINTSIVEVYCVSAMLHGLPQDLNMFSKDESQSSPYQLDVNANNANSIPIDLTDPPYRMCRHKCSDCMYEGLPAKCLIERSHQKDHWCGTCGYSAASPGSECHGGESRVLQR